MRIRAILLIFDFANSERTNVGLDLIFEIWYLCVMCSVHENYSKLERMEIL